MERPALTHIPKPNTYGNILEVLHALNAMPLTDRVPGRHVPPSHEPRLIVRMHGSNTKGSDTFIQQAYELEKPGMPGTARAILENVSDHGDAVIRWDSDETGYPWIHLEDRTAYMDTDIHVPGITEGHVLAASVRAYLLYNGELVPVRALHAPSTAIIENGKGE